MLAFHYHPDILARFPNLQAGVILASGLSNPSTPQALQSAFLAEQAQVLARLGGRPSGDEVPPSDIPSLAAWRSAFRDFGVNPTKYRSAVEALYRRLTKKGDIPSINTLVDICNLVSIRYLLPVAAFDTRALKGPIQVRFAGGSEGFTPLGTDMVEHPEPGEVIFVDPTGLVVARRWCWRQSAESAAGLETAAAIFTIEAQQPGAQGDVLAALTDLQRLLQTYAGGSLHAALLNATHPRLEV